MADEPVVHIGENSPEQIAWRMLETIARVEGMSLYKSPSQGEKKADRLWILQTFAECMFAVKSPKLPEGF